MSFGDGQRKPGKKPPPQGSEVWDGYWHFPPHSSTEPRPRQLPGKVKTICGYTDKRPLTTTRPTCPRCLSIIRRHPQLMNQVLNVWPVT